MHDRLNTAADMHADIVGRDSATLAALIAASDKHAARKGVAREACGIIARLAQNCESPAACRSLLLLQTLTLRLRAQPTCWR